jgi:hypothetical protein
MTHDELLARLDGQIAGSKALGCECLACDNALALRAVVELHEPDTHDAEVSPYCDHCSYAIIEPYPCLTVQTIIKELT